MVNDDLSVKRRRAGVSSQGKGGEVRFHPEGPANSEVRGTREHGGFRNSEGVSVARVKGACEGEAEGGACRGPRTPNTWHLFFLIIIFYLLFLAALGLRCCARAFSSCGERVLLFVVVRGLLIAVASLVAEHGL